MIYIQGNTSKLRNKQNYHSQNNYSLKNGFTSLRMTEYSIFTSRVVTSDVISAKMSGYSKIKLGVQRLIFCDFKYKFKYENGLQMH